MLKSFFAEKEIKTKLSRIREMDPHIFDLLLQKIEFNKYFRFKKTLRQLFRKVIAMGIKNFLKGFSSKGVIGKINNTSKDKKKILFVTGQATFNLVSLSMYLKKTGEFETILLMENPWLTSFMGQYFDTVYVYNSCYDVAFIIKEAKPYIVHVQGAINYYFFGLIAKLLSTSKIIIGLYDIPAFGLTKEQWSGMWGKLDTELDFFTERFIFEKSDGIILTVHSLEAGEVLKRHYNTQIPMIAFFAYTCDNFIQGEDEKYSMIDRKIHLIYGGHVSQSDLPKEIFGDVQFKPLIEKLTNQGICFDIYPSPYLSPLTTKNLFFDYIKLSETNPLFNYHVGIPFHIALQKAAKYDFGSMIYIFEKGCYGEEHTRMVVPTKFFKFLEAGLPIIVSEELEYISMLVKQYQIGIVVKQRDLDNLLEIIKQYDYEKLRCNVKRTREELSMKKNIGRLIEFYEQIHTTKTIDKSNGI